MGRGRVRNSKLDSTVLQNTKCDTPPTVTPSTPPDLHVLNVIFVAFMFIFSMFIYLLTVYSSVPGGDSGELMVTAKEFGVAHPPGYPLFIMLSKLVIEALPYGSTAFRVNVLSCIFGSLTNCLIGLCLLKSTRNVAVSLIICGMLGFSRLFWLWNITGEVFSLNNFICSTIIFVMFLFSKEEDHKRKIKLAYVLASLSGVAMTNQHTSVLLIAATVLFVVCEFWDMDEFTPRNVAQLTLTGLSGLILYLQLPLVSYMRMAKVSWGDHTSLHGLLFHFFRKDFGTFKLLKSDEEVDVFLNLNFLVRDLIRDLTLPVMILALIGVLSITWRTKLRMFVLYLTVSVVAYCTFFCTFANITDISGIYTGVLERFWMQPSLSIVLLAGEGLNEMLKVSKLSKPSMLPFAFLIIALRIHSNYASCDRSRSNHVEDFGRHMLSHLPNDSIMLTSGDLSTNTFRYLTIAEGIRPDIDVLDMSFIGSTWFIPMLAHHMPNVNFPGVGYSPFARTRRYHAQLYDLEMFLDANIKTRPVFVCLKPRQDTRDLEKYDTLPFSYCHQFLPMGGVDTLLYGRTIPTPDLATYLPPRSEQYGEGTWEDVVLHEYWEAKVKPGRFLWNMGELSGSVERKKQFYLSAYEYLLKTKTDIKRLIDEGLLSPVSWNHTSFYSKYMGVQCRQLWLHSGKHAKYEDCQRKHFLEYVESANDVTRNLDNDFKNILMLLENPGM